MKDLLLNLYPTLDHSDTRSKMAAALDSLPTDVLGTLVHELTSEKTASDLSCPGGKIKSMGKGRGLGKGGGSGPIGVPAGEKEEALKELLKKKGKTAEDLSCPKEKTSAEVTGLPDYKPHIFGKMSDENKRALEGLVRSGKLSGKKWDSLREKMRTQEKTSAQTTVTPSKNDWVPKWGGHVTKYLEEEKMKPLFGKLKTSSAGTVITTAMKIAACSPPEMAGPIKKTAASLLKQAAEEKERMGVLPRRTLKGLAIGSGIGTGLGALASVATKSPYPLLSGALTGAGYGTGIGALSGLLSKERGIEAIRRYMKEQENRQAEKTSEYEPSVGRVARLLANT